MEATQNQRVVKLKRRNVENQHHAELEDSRRNTRNFAGNWHFKSKSHFKPKKDRVRHDLLEENAALKAQLEDSQFQQHLFHCRFAAAERKALDLKIQLEEVRNKF